MEQEVPRDGEGLVHITSVPAKQIPQWKYKIAMQTGIKQLMMTTWGGLGDEVCGEPALRYAFKLFPEFEISLLAPNPDLFSHLPFKSVIKTKTPEAAALKDYEWLIAHTNPPHGNMPRDYVLHHFTHVVDFSTICAFQRQIPIADRQLQLSGTPTEHKPMIVVHPGRHWESKTFPKAWWDDVIFGLCALAPPKTVAIVGKHVNEETGYVNVQVPHDALDLRDKLSVTELVTVCKRANVVLTNDSAPLHIASAGDAQIFFIASCKEPEYLMHWRHGVFGWKMKNLGLDGLWNYQSSSPIRTTVLAIDKMDQSLWQKILPSPMSVVQEVWQSL